MTRDAFIHRHRQLDGVGVQIAWELYQRLGNDPGGRAELLSSLARFLIQLDRAEAVVR